MTNTFEVNGKFYEGTEQDARNKYSAFTVDPRTPVWTFEVWCEKKLKPWKQPATHLTLQIIASAL